MRIKQMSNCRSDRGIAMVTTLLLTLLLSILVGAMLSSSTSDVLITGNDIRTNQAFYIAEAGIHRAAGWFTSKFGADSNSGLFVLPEQNASNSAGVAGKLSYTDPPYYQKGASATTVEQQLASSVKVLSGGVLKNVVLSGDSGNTYPASYTVNANDPTGAAKTFTYTQVVNDFSSHLVNQAEGEGKFSVKAILVSIIPPSGGQQGTITWLLHSNGTITRGNNTPIASATMYAYLSARVTPIQVTQTVTSGTQVVSAAPGVIGRGMIAVGANKIFIDSYRSSKGAYNIALAANSFPGQLGSVNRGSRGDVRTNDEFNGYIDISNGTVTGGGYSTFAKVSADNSYTYDPITIDTTGKVLYTTGVPFSETNKHYSQPPLTFPVVPNPPAPPAGSTNYTWSTSSAKTLPAGNYNTISVTKGTLTVPPGNYGAMNVSSQGAIVLGVAGQSSTYNFQDFTATAQTQIVFKGPVTINVKNSLDVGAHGSIADISTPASAIRWNFVGGSGQTVSLGGGGNTLGVFYAPNNPLYMRGGTTFYGSIAALSISLGGNADIHVDEDALSGVLTTHIVSTTSTFTVGYTATNYSLWRITQEID